MCVQNLTFAVKITLIMTKPEDNDNPEKNRVYELR
jgi:hypothetical protein